MRIKLGRVEAIIVMCVLVAVSAIIALTVNAALLGSNGGGNTTTSTQNTGIITTKISQQPDQYQIYREEFVFNSTANNPTLNLGAGMYVYNFSSTVALNVSDVNVVWDPTSFQFLRSTSEKIFVTALLYIYIDPNITNANFTLTEHSGWSNVTIYNYNVPYPQLEASYYDSKNRPFQIVISPSSLTDKGPVFTVFDTIRNSNPKIVLAHFYGWYNQPNWFGGRNCTACLSVSGVPEMGFYNSQNTSIVDTQIVLAKLSGIGGFISAWGGAGNGSTGASYFANGSLGVLFQEASKFNFKVTIEYATKSNFDLDQSQALATFVSDIEYFLSMYSNSSVIFRVNGVPTLFVYATDYYPSSFWANAFSQIRSHYPNVYFIGNSYNYSEFSVFDGLSHYGVGQNRLAPNSTVDFNSTFTVFQDVEIEANLHNKLWFAPVQPGFDNVNHPNEALSYWPRNNGSAYLKAWSAAINSDPDGITITTWNEWHEGTNIEPAASSPEYWAYPNQYLDITGLGSQQFLAMNDESNTTTSTTA